MATKTIYVCDQCHMRMDSCDIILHFAASVKRNGIDVLPHGTYHFSSASCAREWLFKKLRLRGGDANQTSTTE